VTGSNREVRQLLWTATAPARIEWLFNNIRARHSVEPSRLGLLARGTMSNEALHAELNGWFRQIQQLHQSTLELKLRVLTLRKQLAHNSAMFHPTLKQLPANMVLAATLGAPLWEADAWQEWCAPLQTSGRTAKAALPMRNAFRNEQARLREWVRKRPAGLVQHKPLKRTPFTLQRSDTLVRAGFKNTVFKPPCVPAGGGRSAFSIILKRPANAVLSVVQKRPAAIACSVIRKRPAVNSSRGDALSFKAKKKPSSSA